ncbi:MULTISPECIES: helix-turn-helix domain-containing protein [Actinosynnema]|uniref:helix-turn-helix domain-containing protein n=1 Tax=Actinosynnema TaxID=40566 RepID=UPI0020A51DA2|nr:helix-turn-helix domain-containing protein [Actinosynnema pretiosum]MCP2092551.1 putative peptidoglycan binding domain-containing protein [Actinosynnema pretiosum]
MTPVQPDARFAAYLRMLKERSGRGFDRLGKQAGVSGSSLHRYCSGASVPADYRIVHSFAKVCGATGEEQRELHRLWALADLVRSSRGDSADGAGGFPEPALRESEGKSSGAFAESAEGVVGEPEDRSSDGVPEISGAETAGTAGGTSASSAGKASETGGEPRATGVPRGAGEAVVAPGYPEVISLTGAEPRARRRRAPRWVLAPAALAVVALLALAVVLWPRERPVDADDRLLFSPACDAVVMGQHDDCVRELQRLLVRARARMSVDGSFGPETLRRLTAFQVLAGVEPRGVVDAGTKDALYAGRVDMSTWTPERVERRVREVFAEAPDAAVAIARCTSFLDPLWVLPNTNGSRNWGVFQISDGRLRELGGTPLVAFDPEWNIQAAYRLYAARGDFGDWRACQAALQ